MQVPMLVVTSAGSARRALARRPTCRLSRHGYGKRLNVWRVDRVGMDRGHGGAEHPSTVAAVAAHRLAFSQVCLLKHAHLRLPGLTTVTAAAAGRRSARPAATAAVPARRRTPEPCQARPASP